MKEPGRSRVKEQLFALLSEGATVVDAARQLGVNPKTAYAWAGPKKKWATPTGVRFVQVAPSAKKPAMEVRVGAATLVINTGFDRTLLRQLVEALSGAGT